MRHAYKKYKFAGGQDSTQMTLVKLSTNFLRNGKLLVTDARARAVKSYLERLVVKAKAGHMADKNVLLKKLHDQNIVKYLLEVVAPAMKRETGFLRTEKYVQRAGDGAKVTAISFVDEVPTINQLKQSQSEEKPKITKKKIAPKIVSAQ